MMMKSINNCPIDCRLYKSIILSGGTTLFPGFGAGVGGGIKELCKRAALESTEDEKLGWALM